MGNNFDPMTGRVTVDGVIIPLLWHPNDIREEASEYFDADIDGVDDKTINQIAREVWEFDGDLLERLTAFERTVAALVIERTGK